MTTQQTIALRKYNEQYDNKLYRRAVGANAELGVALQNCAIFLCGGYEVDPLDLRVFRGSLSSAEIDFLRTFGGTEEDWQYLVDDIRDAYNMAAEGMSNYTNEY